ncbi:MAG: transposase [Dehalococcoidia bacterium]
MLVSGLTGYSPTSSGAASLLARTRSATLPGDLAVGGSALVFVAAEGRNSDLFIALLERLRAAHPRAPRTHLILNNFVIHSSRRVERFLSEHGDRSSLHFLPP